MVSNKGGRDCRGRALERGRGKGKKVVRWVRRRVLREGVGKGEKRRWRL